MGKKATKQMTLEEELSLMKKEMAKTLGDMRRDFEMIKTQFKKFMTQSGGWIKESHDSIEKHEKFLNGIKNTNENVEEILGNVLMAIRQNEYLQAWYPAQSGFPEMKVTGIHPANLDKKAKKGKAQ